MGVQKAEDPNTRAFSGYCSDLCGEPGCGVGTCSDLVGVQRAKGQNNGAIYWRCSDLCGGLGRGVGTCSDLVDAQGVEGQTNGAIHQKEGGDELKLPAGQARI